MPDLHDAFAALADRHPATDGAVTAVGRRAVARRRRRTIVVVSALAAVVMLCAGTALALDRAPVTEVDVAGTAPVPANGVATATALPGTTSTLAPNDLRSVLPAPGHPVHMRVVGVAEGPESGPVVLCIGPSWGGGCRAPSLRGLSGTDLRSQPGSSDGWSASGPIVRAPVIVQGWFDGATIVLDAVGPMPEGDTEVAAFRAGGPGGPATPELVQAVMTDLVLAGVGEWGGLGGAAGDGVTVSVPWADQALVDLLAARHPGVVITLESAMAPI